MSATELHSSTSDIRILHQQVSAPGGALIINADDWGRDQQTTDRTVQCIRQRTVSSVSAMVFMEDSERAGEIARDAQIDSGLHINVTTRFSATCTPSRVLERQQRITAFLAKSRFAAALYHPGLAASFSYVVSAQIDEFARLYGSAPRRFDGHHHMHLCANILMSDLLPPGAIVRRNFCLERREKNFLNRAYRSTVDRVIARRYQVADYFFSLLPLNEDRLSRIFLLARGEVVEVETHPYNQAEYDFLNNGGLCRPLGDMEISEGYKICRQDNVSQRLAQ